MREDYPNFRRAQRERGPYYSGPAVVHAFRRKTRIALALGVVILIGLVIGWNL
ncbi:hypothetical protein HZY97_17765 [Sphingomonas sp. R-74633]|uniref:hypothetical protein n=1 Tax=Sphingomonas sp. R-74633 TaxID=2751188 RepID=UPI0015D355F2|nr:hypothetical protein [Sphingomonas sp. R-74633]NYT42625.1 hypothetical protein [Sphingomonas sp. R-74633]